MHNKLALQIKFQTFYNRIGWRLGGRSKSKTSGALIDFQIGIEGLEYNLDKETESLKQVKKLLDAYPLELERDDMNDINVETVLKYKNYIQKLPILIKLIDFCDHSKIRICYETLDMSGQAKETLPEEALALLDGQFGDIKVRIFAVKKLTMLTDSQIALLMPQLIQALKYELFHQSPLAEFLLEKSLHNTRVVGHAFFWQLKANLEQSASRERFYLLLERFLMCCGQFKNELFKQNLVDKALIRLSNFVEDSLEVKKESLTKTLDLMHEELKKEEVTIKMM